MQSNRSILTRDAIDALNRLVLLYLRKLSITLRSLPEAELISSSFAPFMSRSSCQLWSWSIYGRFLLKDSYSVTRTSISACRLCPLSRSFLLSLCTVSRNRPYTILGLFHQFLPSVESPNTPDLLVRAHDLFCSFTRLFVYADGSKCGCGSIAVRSHHRR
jgi:hypothetical protein